MQSQLKRVAASKRSFSANDHLGPEPVAEPSDKLPKSMKVAPPRPKTIVLRGIGVFGLVDIWELARPRDEEVLASRQAVEIRRAPLGHLGLEQPNRTVRQGATN